MQKSVRLTSVITWRDVPRNAAYVGSNGVHDDLMIDRLQNRVTTEWHIVEVVVKVGVVQRVEYRRVRKRRAFIIDEPTSYVCIVPWGRE